MDPNTKESCNSRPFNTSITGPLPNWLPKLPFIETLDLSHNFLDGPLTNLPSNPAIESFRTFPIIEDLSDQAGVRTRVYSLQNNHFNGSIPDSLCNALDLLYLNLARNMLSGTLPDCFGHFLQLNVIILSSNQLSGVIPSSLGNLSYSLQSLQLNNNSFHGELPTTLANCTNLALLDVGDNRLSGNIPRWIGEKIKLLRILRLHNNSFTGEIPLELCESSLLQIMDFGHNNLTGTIPRCFKNLSGMIGGNLDYNYAVGIEPSLVQIMKGVQLEYTTIMKLVVNMDLSSNRLVGEIPKELVRLSGLLGLNLSNNHLTGPIPDRIGDMKSLMSLDLCLNDISGMIPQSISALNFLSYLNVSHNNLSGRIPTGGQLQTLIDPSIYAGNNELCGSPLPTNCNREGPENGRNAEEDEEDDGADQEIWIYGATSGFTTGFIGILAILVLKNSWRLALFNYVGGYEM